MDSNNFFKLGIIVKAQGIKGEVKIKPFTDTPDVLCTLKCVLLDGEKVNVIKSRCDNTMVYMLFEGIDNRNQAETLRLKEITISREDAPKPDDGRYYLSDLINCLVFDDEGVELGKLTDIIQGGGNDVYVIKKRGKEILVPVLKSVIKSIDIDKKKIILLSSKLKEVAVYAD